MLLLVGYIVEYRITLFSLSLGNVKTDNVQSVKISKFCTPFRKIAFLLSLTSVLPKHLNYMWHIGKAVPLRISTQAAQTHFHKWDLPESLQNTVPSLPSLYAATVSSLYCIHRMKQNFSNYNR
jgi:hypothetical protein